MKELLINVNGESLKVYAEYVGGKLWVHANGQNFVYNEAKIQKYGATNAASSLGDLLAPMPGKITKILSQKDQTVRTGEIILVMEAMKMEYSLRAPRDGKVSLIKCREKDQVELGQLLAVIE